MKCFLRFLTDQSADDALTSSLKTAVENLRISKHGRKEYMTLQEKLYEEREEGRAEERQNTERERRRADAAEEKVKQLEAQLAVLQNKR